MLKSGGLDNLQRLVMGTSNRNIIKHGTWAMSNLCRGKMIILGKPLPDYQYTYVAVPALVKVMCEETDPEILVDSLWALSYLTDGDEERVDKILSLNILFGLVKNLE